VLNLRLADSLAILLILAVDGDVVASGNGVKERLPVAFKEQSERKGGDKQMGALRRR
jgi:hypothetical protein